MEKNFKIWLEQTETKPIVFCDMDETLVHNIESDWLKDNLGNKKFAELIVPKDAGVKEIFAKGKNMFIFPRPGAVNFMKAINDFADFIILSHNDVEYCEKVINAMNWNKYVKACYSTKQLGPEELSKKYHLDHRKWILVDNLVIHSVEVINKLRILGLAKNSGNAKDIAKHVAKNADAHFIDVDDWLPTIKEYDDFELWKVLPKIKQKFGLDWSEDNPNF
jgi:hypothetical protein